MRSIVALALCGFIGLGNAVAIGDRPLVEGIGYLFSSDECAAAASLSGIPYRSLSPLQQLSSTYVVVSTSSVRPTISNSLCAGTTTITDTSALADLSTCTTWYGDVTVASITVAAQSNEPTATITLGGIRNISQDLVFTNLTAKNGNGDRVTLALDAPLLEKVGRRLKVLYSASQLSLTFPKLQYLQGMIYDSVDIASSSNPGYDPPSRFSTLSTVYYRNTTAKSVPIGLSANASSIAVILNNTQLSTINMWSYTPPSIEIAGNAPNLRFSTSQSFMSSGIISGCTDFNTPLLSRVAHGLTLENNPFTSIDLPALLSASTLNIASNPQLKAIDLLSFNTARNLEITNNPNLAEIQLPALSRVSTTLNIVGGTFTTIALPALTSVNAGVTIISNATLNCSGVSAAEQYAKLFQASLLCTGVPNSTINASGQTSNSHSNQLTAPVQAGIGVGAAVAGIALLIGAAVLYNRRRRRRRIQPNKAVDKHEFSGFAGSELYSLPSELHDGYETELYAPHGASELHVEEQKCYKLP